MSEASKEAMELVNAILKASGSALRHYSMHKTRSDMFAAAQFHLDKARLAALDEACSIAHDKFGDHDIYEAIRALKTN